MFSTQPCGQKLETVNQEREQPTFQRGSEGSKAITGWPPNIGGLPDVYITNMGFRVQESGPRVVNIGFEVRENGRRRAMKEHNWLLKQLLVSHHSTTFLVIKQRSLPKMKQNRCKMKVRGPKRVARGPENRLLGTGSGVRPRSWSLGPQCPSKGSK